MAVDVQFRFSLQWQAKGPSGVMSDFCSMESYTDLGEARTQHRERSRGRWVQQGMVNPHVSALRVFKYGRLLPDELAPKVDCAEFLRATTGTSS